MRRVTRIGAPTLPTHPAALMAIGAGLALAGVLAGVLVGCGDSPPAVARTPVVEATGEDVVCNVNALLALDADADADADAEIYSGMVPIVVGITGNFTAEMTFQVSYSVDNGANWLPATVHERQGTVHVPAGGLVFSYNWDTEVDLGLGLFDGVWLRAVPTDACGEGTAAVIENITIENGEPQCGVTVGQMASPQSGVIVIPFSLAYDEAAPVDVKVLFSVDAGANYLPASLLLDRDCDADGHADAATQLATSPDGVAHCLSWDSQADFAYDVDISVWVSCWVAGEHHSSAVSAPVRVNNDPAPGAGDLLITELLLKSSFTAGRYMEIANTTPHTLDLRGLEVRRWAAGQNPYVSQPRNAFTVHGNDPIWLPPGGFAVLGSSDNPDVTGCFVPNVVWPANFAFNDDSLYRLEHSGEVVAELSVVDDSVWDFHEGIAWGLDPQIGVTGDWTAIGSWCAQRSVLTQCAGTYAEIGTPGRANDPCY